ncbi:hypothetical protein HDV00_000158 [Rhizophlyctis rosea]|nr:hypothetical protein HDV00_000158 [Rhizophlyctis rosea]
MIPLLPFLLFLFSSLTLLTSSDITFNSDYTPLLDTGRIPPVVIAPPVTAHASGLVATMGPQEADTARQHPVLFEGLFGVDGLSLILAGVLHIVGVIFIVAILELHRIPRISLAVHKKHKTNKKTSKLYKTTKKEGGMGTVLGLAFAVLIAGSLFAYLYPRVILSPEPTHTPHTASNGYSYVSVNATAYPKGSAHYVQTSYVPVRSDMVGSVVGQDAEPTPTAPSQGEKQFLGVLRRLLEVLKRVGEFVWGVVSVEFWEGAGGNVGGDGFWVERNGRLRAEGMGGQSVIYRDFAHIRGRVCRLRCIIGSIVIIIIFVSGRANKAALKLRVHATGGSHGNPERANTVESMQSDSANDQPGSPEPPTASHPTLATTTRNRCKQGFSSSRLAVLFLLLLAASTIASPVLADTTSTTTTTTASTTHNEPLPKLLMSRQMEEWPVTRKRDLDVNGQRGGKDGEVVGRRDGKEDLPLSLVVKRVIGDVFEGVGRRVGGWIRGFVGMVRKGVSRAVQTFRCGATGTGRVEGLPAAVAAPENVMPIVEEVSEEGMHDDGVRAAPTSTVTASTCMPRLEINPVEASTTKTTTIPTTITFTIIETVTHTTTQTSTSFTTTTPPHPTRTAKVLPTATVTPTPTVLPTNAVETFVSLPGPYGADNTLPSSTAVLLLVLMALGAWAYCRIDDQGMKIAELNQKLRWANGNLDRALEGREDDSRDLKTLREKFDVLEQDLGEALKRVDAVREFGREEVQRTRREARRETRRVQTALDACRSELRTKDSELVDVKCELAGAWKKLDAVEGYFNEATDMVVAARAERDAKGKKVAELEAELETLRAAGVHDGRIKQELKDVKRVLSRAQTELANTREDLGKSQEKERQLVVRNQELQRELRGEQEVVRMMEEQLNEATAVSLGRKEEIVTLLEQHTVDERELKEAKEEITRLETRVKELETEAGDARSEADILARTITEQERLLEKNGAALKDLRENSESLKKDMERVQEVLRSREDKHRGLEEELRRRAGIERSLRAKVEEVQSEKSAAAGELRKEEGKVVGLEQHLRELRSQLTKVEAEREKETQLKNEWEKHYKACQEQGQQIITGLMQDVNGLAGEVKRLTDEVETAGMLNQYFGGLLQQREAELAAARGFVPDAMLEGAMAEQDADTPWMQEQPTGAQGQAVSTQQGQFEQQGQQFEEQGQQFTDQMQEDDGQQRSEEESGGMDIKNFLLLVKSVDLEALEKLC